MRIGNVFGIVVLSLSLSILLVNCKSYNAEYEKVVNNPDIIHGSVKKYSDVIVHDIFSPPVASRIYAYSTIAAYEAMAPNYQDYQSLAGQSQRQRQQPAPLVSVPV